jgi:hypothetical protein
MGMSGPVCSKCEAPLQGGARFCVSCGATLSESERSQAAALPHPQPVGPSTHRPVPELSETLPCQSCGADLKVQDAFDVQTWFFSGEREEGVNPYDPPSRWPGNPHVVPPEEGGSAEAGTPPAERMRRVLDALHGLPRARHTGFRRALWKPCPACGSDDPHGLVG